MNEALEKLSALAALGQAVLDLVKESGLAKPKRRARRVAVKDAAPAPKAKLGRPAKAKPQTEASATRPLARKLRPMAQELPEAEAEGEEE